MDDQLKEYINEWRKQRAKEEDELKRLKEKQAKRKVRLVYIDDIVFAKSCCLFLKTAKLNVFYLIVGISRWRREAPRPEEEGGGRKESSRGWGEEATRHRREEAATRGGREETPGYAPGYEGLQQNRT